MKNLLLTAVTAIVLGSAPAWAADMGMPSKAPPVAPPPPSWTGCYLGAGGGYGMYDLRSQTFSAGVPVNTPLDESGRGWLGIGSVGCDYQFQVGSLGNWVIGAFGDGAFSDIYGLYTGNNFNVGLNSGNMKETSEWDVGGRIGALLTPTLLAYGSAGFSGAHFSGATLLTTPPVSVSGLEPSQNYTGWFLGSGLEYAFTWLPIKGLFLKTEYRYYSYGSKNLIDLTAAGAPNGFIDTLQPRVQTVTTELVYRFNWTGR
ncbi:MAG TPA: outer membrane beta-barrel protein [Xanthobacteraceae bacterium]|nr:outer membrane beta-barrel protein [Xanthobacteraceae bacterium]